MSAHHEAKFRWVLVFQAIAIVFGDIGTSVLYAMKETFFASRFGQLQDRFGLNWVVLRERPRADGA